MAASRASTLSHWKRRAEELAHREEELRAKMHGQVAPIVSSKRILLFGEMLTAVGFPGASALCQAMAADFKITGEIEATGVFPSERVVPKSTIEDVWHGAPGVCAAVRKSLGPTGDAEMDKDVSEATAKRSNLGGRKARCRRRRRRRSLVGS